MVYLFRLLLETGSHSAVLAALELPEICLPLQGAGIKGVYHCTQHNLLLKSYVCNHFIVPLEHVFKAELRIISTITQER